MFVLNRIGFIVGPGSEMRSGTRSTSGFGGNIWAITNVPYVSEPWPRTLYVEERFVTEQLAV